MILRFVLGLLISSAIGWFAYRHQSLSSGGVGGAILTGTLTLTASYAWATILITFFLSSTLLGKIGEARKAPARAYFSKSEQRDFWQVMANGGVATGIALLFILTDNSNLWFAYLGALATANADTLATELGTLSQTPPRLITNLKIAESGQSGAVSWLGLAAAFGGASFIALTGKLLDSGTLIFLIVLAGFFGSLVDSLLGATVQALYWCEDRQKLTEKTICSDGTPAQLRQGSRWMNNDVVNFCATLCGALLVMIG